MKPLFRWAGSKARIVDELARRMPHSFARYHEPFCGSAALFFHLESRWNRPAAFDSSPQCTPPPNAAPTARLSDANPSLALCMRALQQCDAASWKKLERQLERLASKHGPKTYRAQARALQRLEGTTDLQVASRFLYIVGTNFNGLWRENLAGRYNVPIGRKRFVYSLEALMRGAGALKSAEISHAQWSDAVRDVSAGDFVYFDPPYFAAHSHAYTGGGFTLREHARLAEWVHRAQAAVLLSLPDSWITRDLYRGLRIDRVSARRSLGANASSRKDVGELLIRNY